jgi:hypothetical protein
MKIFTLGHLSKVVTNEKRRGVEKLASVRRWYRTVVIDVCLLFNLVLIFSLKNFRFLFVKPS